MTMIGFFIPGVPVGKGRARIGRLANGRPVAYTPAKTENYEALVRRVAAQAMAGQVPIEGPVTLVLTAVFPVPTSWSKKRQRDALQGIEVPTKKPDADNVLKAIADALNGICYGDDAQVWSASVSKQYGELPGVSVIVGKR